MGHKTLGALHSITVDWSIGLIPEFWFHLTNSPISIFNVGPNSQTPIFFPQEIKTFRIAKKGQELAELGADLVLSILPVVLLPTSGLGCAGYWCSKPFSKLDFP